MPADYLSLEPTLVPSVLTAAQAHELRTLAADYQPDRFLRGALQRVFSPFLHLQVPSARAAVAQAVAPLLPNGFALVHDVFFTVRRQHPGFPWHTGFESTRFLRDDRRLVSLWVSLTDLDPTTGGRLRVFPDTAASYALSAPDIALSQQMLEDWSERGTGSLFRRGRRDLRLGTTLLRKTARQLMLRRRLESRAVVHSTRQGDAVLFADTSYHRTERVKRPAPFARHAWVLRFVHQDAAFDLDATRLLLDNLDDHWFYQLLLREDIDSYGAWSQWVSEHAQEVVRTHPRRR